MSNTNEIVFYRMMRHIPKKYHKFLKDNFDAGDYKERLNKHCVWFLAIVDKKVVGCTYIELVDGTWEEEIIFGGSRVDPNHQGKGIYRNLLNLKTDYLQMKVNDENRPLVVDAYCRDTTFEKFQRMGFESVRGISRYPQFKWVQKRFIPETGEE